MAEGTVVQYYQQLKKPIHKVLFVLKQRSNYGISYGLINSCILVAQSLQPKNIECKVITVIDNNSIDSEVTSYQPTHCFIEAIWVVPSKLPVLIGLHPKVKWNVRIHSNVPFLAQESFATDWLNQYNQLTKYYPANLQSLFSTNPTFTLVQHSWNNHVDFIKIVNQMDIGLQVSFSESFNLVSADFVSNGLPVVGSNEIGFLAPQYHARTTNAEDISAKIQFAINNKTHGTHQINQTLLAQYTNNSVNQWINLLNR